MHMFSESVFPDFMFRADAVFHMISPNLPADGQRRTGRIQGEPSNKTQE